MDTAFSSPAETDANALVQAHLRAALAWGIVIGLLAILGLLQLLNPGVFGDAAWVSIGRLNFARHFAVLAGLLGNLIAVGVYLAIRPIGRLMVRWKLGALAFAVLNVVIGVPALVMAWAAILPPAAVLEYWFVVGSIQSSEPLGILMLGSTLGWTGFAWLFPSQPTIRPNNAAMLMLVSAGFGMVMVTALFRAPSLAVASWTLALLANIFLVWGCVLALRPFAANPVTRSATLAPQSRLIAWGARPLMLIALVLLVVGPFLGDANDDGPSAMTASEKQGRAVFIREGCATCHQKPWDHSVGPDLYREFGARSADWHLTHLFSPQAVSPTSVMPSFARYFNGAPDQPKPEARDLVAYLETLGRREELSTAPNLAKAPPASRALRVGELPALPAGDRAAGMKLFGNYCVGCHGLKGEGDGPGAAGLRPKPANLAAHRYTREQVTAALWNGVAGTAMPAWRDQPRDRFASLVEAVQSLSQVADAGGPDAAQLELGARVFAAHCTQCHGERGAGDGFSAASLAVAPANFQRQQPSLDYALRVIAGGVEGTPMAPWTSRIKYDELLAVAHYVRSFYTGGAR